MTPEDLVPTRETSERLKAAGFPQETYFSWTEQEGHYGIEHWQLFRAASGADRLCSAPTLGEILEQLPDSMLFPRDGRKGRCAGYLYLSKIKHLGQPPYRAEYIDAGGILQEFAAAVNPAEAAALLWLRVSGKDATP